MASNVHRRFRLGGSTEKGDDVAALQSAINTRLGNMGVTESVTVDGEFGPHTLYGALDALYYLGVTRHSVGMPTKNPTQLTWRAQNVIRAITKRTPAQVALGKARVTHYKRSTPLRERAYRVAAGQVGVMETGGNNQGVPLSRYERPNGATGPEPWCGDFMAYCYRQAGSTRVSRSWAAVRLIRGLLGIKATDSPHRGDLVRFDFEGPGSLSHVGMFVRHVAPGVIETIEGNTGTTGAVSDSSTGGDGVYRKHRPTSLVHDYLHVLG